MKGKQIHFMGAGGIGVSAIMHLAASQGAHVSGCDLKKNSTTGELEKKGIRIESGHSPSHLDGVELLVYSSAITEQNLELKYAKERGIECIKRSVMLDRLMAKNKVIGVTGSHGKTTTTALIAHILLSNNLDPSVAVGGLCPALNNSNFRIGHGEWYVTEMDESDASLLDSEPAVGVLTNIDREHLEYYGSYENLLAVFKSYIERVSQRGYFVYCKDDAVIFDLISQSEAPNLISYGFDTDADLVVTKVGLDENGMEFSFTLASIDYTVESKIVGHHNVLNICAALLASCYAGVELSAAINSIGSFESVKRRFDILYASGPILIDDYAHHPTEISACLRTCKEKFSANRVVAVFQAHRYTRLKDLWAEFKAALELADEVIVCDVYAASESPIDGVSGDKLAFEMYENGFERVQFIPHFDGVIDYLFSSIKDSEVVITLGAGDVNKIVYELSEKYQNLNCFNK